MTYLLFYTTSCKVSDCTDKSNKGLLISIIFTFDSKTSFSLSVYSFSFSASTASQYHLHAITDIKIHLFTPPFIEHVFLYIIYHICKFCQYILIILYIMTKKHRNTLPYAVFYLLSRLSYTLFEYLLKEKDK